DVLLALRWRRAHARQGLLARRRRRGDRRRDGERLGARGGLGLHRRAPAADGTPQPVRRDDALRRDDPRLLVPAEIAPVLLSAAIWIPLAAGVLVLAVGDRSPFM